jgi:hypothetical protein
LLPKTYAKFFTALTNEFHTGCFKRTLQLCACFIRDTRPCSSLNTLDRWQRQPSARSEFRLRPAEKATGSAELFNRHETP